MVPSTLEGFGLPAFESVMTPVPAADPFKLSTNAIEAGTPCSRYTTVHIL